jgi:hypothetical protein
MITPRSRVLSFSMIVYRLTSRGSSNRPSKPVVVRHVHNILRNRFYLGLFTWGGVEYRGTHEQLVSIETFATVQAIMASRRQVGEKPRKHPHYLKGTIFCARCGSRMLFSQNRGRHGTLYDYFTCIGRHNRRNNCDLPHIPVAVVEEAIATYYDTFVLSPDVAAGIHDCLMKVAHKRYASINRVAKRERKRILDLEQERRKLLQAHLAGAVPLDLLKEHQDRITAELANAGAALANTEVHWETVEANLQAALGLATRFGEAYRRASPTVRRHFNQAVLEWVRIDVDGEITQVELAQPFKILLDEDLPSRLAHEMENPGSFNRGRGSNMDL